MLPASAVADRFGKQKKPTPQDRLDKKGSSCPFRHRPCRRRGQEVFQLSQWFSCSGVDLKMNRNNRVNRKGSVPDPAQMASVESFAS